VATFALLHGAWHGPSCWDAVTERLEALGHTTTAPDLPLHDPTATYEQRVRPVLEALDGADDDAVVVVAHSQSSVLAALVAADRPVSLVVHLCPRMGTFEPSEGAPAAFREGFPFPPTRPDGTSVWDPDAAIEVMYPRLSADRGRELAQHLRPMGLPHDDYPLSEYPDVPTVLIYAAEDELFEPAFERFLAREVLGVDPIQIPGGHFAMAEDPEALADLLDSLAPG
jgi:pimeloyl-ACP methyl ester carboxylesterase